MKCVYIILFSVLVSWLAGCDVGSDEIGSFESPNPIEEVAVTSTINSTGGVLTSADGIFSLTVPVDAVFTDTEFTITQKTVPDALGEVGYLVEPLDVLASRPMMVTFHHSEGVGIAVFGPQSGRYNLRLNNSLELSADTSRTGLFGLVGDFHPLDADQAKDVILNGYLPGILQLPLADDVAAPEGSGLVAAYGPFPIEPGDVVAPAVGTSYDPNTGKLTERDDLGLTIQSRGYFFWVDLAEGTVFEHPTLFVFVEADTGQVFDLLSGWYPKINGVETLQLEFERLNHPLRILESNRNQVTQRNVLPILAQSDGVGPGDPGIPETVYLNEKIALLINHRHELDATRTIQKMRAALKVAGYDETQIHEWPPEGEGDVTKLTMRAFIDWIRDRSELVGDFPPDAFRTGGFQEVVIYLTCHSHNPTGAYEPTAAGAGPILADGTKITYGQLHEILSAMSPDRGGIMPYKLIIDTCHTVESVDVMNRQRARNRDMLEANNRDADKLDSVGRAIALFDGEILSANTNRTNPETRAGWSSIRDYVDIPDLVNILPTTLLTHAILFEDALPKHPHSQDPHIDFRHLDLGAAREQALEASLQYFFQYMLYLMFPETHQYRPTGEGLGRDIAFVNQVGFSIHDGVTEEDQGFEVFNETEVPITVVAWSRSRKIQFGPDRDLDRSTIRLEPGEGQIIETTLDIEENVGQQFRVTFDFFLPPVDDQSEPAFLFRKTIYVEPFVEDCGGISCG